MFNMYWCWQTVGCCGAHLVLELSIKAKLVLWFPVWDLVAPEPVHRGVEVARFQSFDIANILTKKVTKSCVTASQYDTLPCYKIWNTEIVDTFIQSDFGFRSNVIYSLPCSTQGTTPTTLYGLQHTNPHLLRYPYLVSILTLPKWWLYTWTTEINDLLNTPLINPIKLNITHIVNVGTVVNGGTENKTNFHAA